MLSNWFHRDALLQSSFRNSNRLSVSWHEYIFSPHHCPLWVSCGKYFKWNPLNGYMTLSCRHHCQVLYTPFLAVNYRINCQRTTHRRRCNMQCRMVRLRVVYKGPIRPSLPEPRRFPPAPHKSQSRRPHRWLLTPYWTRNSLKRASEHLSFAEAGASSSFPTVPKHSMYSAASLQALLWISLFRGVVIVTDMLTSFCQQLFILSISCEDIQGYFPKSWPRHQPLLQTVLKRLFTELIALFRVGCRGKSFLKCPWISLIRKSAWPCSSRTNLETR